MHLLKLVGKLSMCLQSTALCGHGGVFDGQFHGVPRVALVAASEAQIEGFRAICRSTATAHPRTVPTLRTL